MAMRMSVVGNAVRRNYASGRNFSSSAHHNDAYETAKWQKITIAGAVGCTAFASYLLSKPHPHYDTPPAYPYIHIRNKEFPWGPDGLFETKHEAGHSDL